MKGNIARIIILILFVFFVGLYLIGNSEYYDYEERNKSRLTNEQIKIFEEDVKEGNAIDVENYLKLNQKNYSNPISETTLNISNTISKTFNKGLNYLFKKINSAMTKE